MVPTGFEGRLLFSFIRVNLRLLSLFYSLHSFSVVSVLWQRSFRADLSGEMVLFFICVHLLWLPTVLGGGVYLRLLFSEVSCLFMFFFKSVFIRVHLLWPPTVLGGGG